jgi:hypothetical protein
MKTNYMPNFVLFYYILSIIFPPARFVELPSSGRISHFYYIKHLKDQNVLFVLLLKSWNVKNLYIFCRLFLYSCSFL